ncbi:MAG: radical SAM protein [bacterium]|nr:radical SAM protein [bacterium]
MNQRSPTALTVSEIYRTILGESTETGRPCAIVRLTGCHRRCTYCDSAHAFAGGERLTVPEVLAAVAALGCRTVLVTGGEPLLQPGCPELLAALVADGRRTILETSGTRGALPLAAVPAGVRRVVDVKTPGSGLGEGDVAWDQFGDLGPLDELKVVCCDRADYEWSRDLVRDGRRLPAATPVVFSAAEGLLPPATLAGWLVEDGLDVRFQLQLHKTLWPEGERRA